MMTFVVFIEKRKNLLQGRRNQIESGGTNLGEQKNRKKFLFGWFRLFLWWLVVVMYFSS